MKSPTANRRKRGSHRPGLLRVSRATWRADSALENSTAATGPRRPFKKANKGSNNSSQSNSGWRKWITRTKKLARIGRAQMVFQALQMDGLPERKRVRFRTWQTYRRWKAPSVRTWLSHSSAGHHLKASDVWTA